MTNFDEYDVTRFLDEYGYQFSPKLNVRAVLIQGEWAESGMLIYGVKTGGQKLAAELRSRGATSTRSRITEGGARRTVTIWHGVGKSATDHIAPKASRR